MPATRAHVQLDAGIADLYCPACAAPVFTTDGGPAEELCEHVRFFIDPSGEMSIAEPDGVAEAERRRQEQIIELVESTDSWEDFLTQAAKLLPASAVILELEEPGEEDGEEGSQAVVAFDLAAEA